MSQKNRNPKWVSKEERRVSKEERRVSKEERRVSKKDRRVSKEVPQDMEEFWTEKDDVNEVFYQLVADELVAEAEAEAEADKEGRSESIGTVMTLCRLSDLLEMLAILKRLNDPEHCAWVKDAQSIADAWDEYVLSVKTETSAEPTM